MSDPVLLSDGTKAYWGAAPAGSIAPGINGQVLVTALGIAAWALILDVNVDPAAAIAVSKLAHGTANQVLVTDGGGTTTQWASPAGGGSVLGTGRSVTAGSGLTGGGDLSADRSLAVDTTVIATRAYADAGDAATLASANAYTNAYAAPLTRTLTAGAGMTGGGTLAADRTFTVGQNADASVVVNADDIQVAAAIQSGAALGATAVQPTRSISTTAPLAGGGDLSANRTFSVATVSNTSSGVVPQVGAAYRALVGDSTGANAIWTTALLADQSTTGSPTAVSIVQPVNTANTPTAFLITGGAHTTLANAEVTDVNLNLARTVQFTGSSTLATQRAVRIQPVTYSSDTATKALTTVATLEIGLPVAGTNVTFTNKPAALWINDANPAIRLGLAPGSGAGSAAAGLQPHAMCVANVFQINKRNAADTGDLVLLSTSSGAVALGNTTDNVTIACASGGGNGIALQPNSANGATFRTTSIDFFISLFQFINTTATPSFTHQATGTASATGQAFTLGSQSVTGTGTCVGGTNLLRAGDASGAGTANTGGKLTIRGGNASAATSNTGGDVAILVGTGSTANGNITVGTNNTTWNSMQGGIFLGNGTAPSGNPTSGGYMFAAAGAGKWRGSGGTVTTFGPADPHCPRCMRDFAVEYQHDTKGHLAICFWCLVEALEKHGVNPDDHIIHRKAS